MPATPENLPVEITSTGETTYENGIATAHDNVAIHVGDTDIYADRASTTRPRTKSTAKATSDIYRGTISISPSTAPTMSTPRRSTPTTCARVSALFRRADEIAVLTDNETIVKNGNFTTDDSHRSRFSSSRAKSADLRKRSRRFSKRNFLCRQGSGFLVALYLSVA